MTPVSTMSDPFNILGQDIEAPTFEEAVHNTVSQFQAAAERFGTLQEQVPESSFTEEEWRVIQLTAEDLVTALERADEGYVAVQYDGNAWYRILESLDTVNKRLESAIGLMERVRDREAGSTADSA